MTVNLKSHQNENRESRLGSITGYSGTLRDLSTQSGCGGPGNRERCFSQASLCNAACALGLTSFIVDAVIVQHSPSGCAVTAMSVSNSTDQLAATIKLDNSKSAYVCTDMNESDTVFGATENLGQVIRETYQRYQPKAIFIGASCVSGVIGEDLESIARELHDELGIPIAAIHCEGFRTKIWASGFDAAFHAILTHIVKKPEKKTNVVNVINFFGGARKEITEIFSHFGIEPLFVITNTTVDQLARMSESIATLSTCGTLGTYLGNGLEEAYGVPYVRSLQPHGIAGIESWLGELGKVIGKEKEYYYYIERNSDVFLENRSMSRRFSTVSNAADALSIAKFLVNDFGLFPARQYITDATPEPYRDAIRQYFKEFQYGIEADVLFSTDGYLIHEDIKKTDYFGSPLLVGSIFEKKLAEKLSGNFLAVSVPIKERLILDSSYVGYRGGLKLLEDIYGYVLRKFN